MTPRVRPPMRPSPCCSRATLRSQPRFPPMRYFRRNRPLSVRLARSLADPTAMVTVHDVPGGLTVGTLSLAGTAAQTWNVRLSNPLIMNNNGNGALISNVNPAVGNYQLQISGFQFPLMLADNLAVTNTSGSTKDSVIVIGFPLTWSGNITLNYINNIIHSGHIHHS